MAPLRASPDIRPRMLGLRLALLALVATGSAAAAGEPGGSGAPSAAPAAAAPERIVSLNPSLTATLLAIGAGPRLVGVDDFSARQQSAVAELPRVGGLFDPSLERLVALRPDLVVLVPSAAQRDFRSRLRELEIPVLALDPLGFEEVLETIRVLGAHTGHEAEARARVDAIRRTRRRVEAVTEDRLAPRVVLVVQREPLYVVGRGSFVDEMLRAVGAENVGAELGEPYPRVSREWLLAAAPDVLLDSSGDPEPAARYWARWSSLPAVGEGRVVALARGRVTLPGPWLDRALRVLLEAVHGSEATKALAAADPAAAPSASLPRPAARPAEGSGARPGPASP